MRAREQRPGSWLYARICVSARSASPSRDDEYVRPHTIELKAKSY
jgi:hypothetical protein